MVTISTIQSSNSNINHLHEPSLVGVFVGGTSGIGETTVRAFMRHTKTPRIYLIGRDQTRASEIIDDLKLANPEGQVHFIKSDVSLLREVDEACRVIQHKEDKINLLFLSPGVGTAKGRDETDEGLDKKLNLHYYSRMRFVVNFLPELTKAGTTGDTAKPGTGLSRVVSVLGAGSEAALQLADLSLKIHYSMSMEHLASSHPNISFIHCSPGIVRTRLMRDMNPLGKFAIDSLMFLVKSREIPLVESGERHLHVATSPQFPPRAWTSNDAAEGSDAHIGSGFYRVAPDGSTYKSSKIMQQYREDGTRSLIWKHTLETFAKVCGDQRSEREDDIADI